MSNENNLSELPKGWVWTDVGSISDVIHYGYTASATNEPIGPRMLRITDIQNNSVNWVAVPYCQITPEEEQKYLLKAGDLVFARTGATVGKSFLIKGNIPKAVFASYLIRIILSDPLEKDFVYYFFQSNSYWLQIYEGQLGIGQPNVNSKTLSKIVLPLPPFAEQHRIVARIEELFTKLDAGVVELKKVKAQLKHYRQAVLKYAFEGKLTEEWREAHKDELEPASKLLERIKEERKRNAKGKYKELSAVDTSGLAELPEGWVWTELELISEVISGFAFKSNDFCDEGIPTIKISNVSHGEFLWKQQEYLPPEFIEQYREFQVFPETVLIALTRPITKNTVKACLYPLDASVGLLNQRVAKIETYRGYYKMFLFYLIQSEFFKSHIKRAMSETLQPNLSPLKLKQFVVSLPHELEQHKIVEEIECRFSVADNVVQVVDQSLKQAEMLHQSILKRSFEGKLVPQDPTDEPASVLLERIKAERENREIEAQSKTKTKRKRELVQKRTRFNDYVE